jgi:nucleoid-associated protein YgaU
MGQPVMSVSDATGTLNTTVFGGPTTGLPVAFYYYTVVQGDRMDSIANKVYGIPDYWWKIANANPEIFYPEVLATGSVIRIPA